MKLNQAILLSLSTLATLTTQVAGADRPLQPTDMFKIDEDSDIIKVKVAPSPSDFQDPSVTMDDQEYEEFVDKIFFMDDDHFFDVHHQRQFKQENKADPIEISEAALNETSE